MTMGTAMKITTISIHAPPRGATGTLKGKFYSNTFQFTPLREGRRAATLATVTLEEFQFTPLREGRPFSWHHENGLPKFQFTPLREGRHRGQLLCTDCADFNSRPSARGDRTVKELALNQLISIHAPPRGATTAFARRRKTPYIISIHAPPRGATLDVGFNVTRPNISIHAPPRGATIQLQPVQGEGWHISIHAPPRGATDLVETQNVVDVFQFTPLREGRPAIRRTATA